MIKVENIEVWGWEHAIRGMRNPMNSWDKSDSYPAVDCGKCGNVEREGVCQPKEQDCTPYECYALGPNDLSLMQRLFNGGTEHRKYLRQIIVSLDITAPLYWWKEFDTYKVGTVANSCSTMHKIQAKEFTPDDFSHEHLLSMANNDPMDAVFINGTRWDADDALSITIEVLNYYRKRFLSTNEKCYWWQMIQLLPSSYNQRRTVTMSYENVFTILRQREGHKLDEWRNLCEILKGLPNVKEIGGLT